MELPTLRKQKLVSVCSILEASAGDQYKSRSHRTSSSKTKVHTQITAPVNEYNLIMLEIYPESKTREQDSIMPCHKLNFISLCCKENTRAEDVRYDFAKEYPFVEYVDFSGHIGSMRLAFDLLKNFKRLKEVIFVINDFNAKFPNEYGDDFHGLKQYLTVESVKILHDFSIVEKSTLDIMTGTWRLDEFLQGCHDCFPNLKKLEVCIHGTGANYDKVNNFIVQHPELNQRYAVEINNDKLRTKRKPLHHNHRPTSVTRKALLPPTPSPTANYVKLPPASTTTTADKYPANNMQIAIIPDLRLVKKEIFEEEEMQVPLNMPLSGFQNATNSQFYQPSVPFQPQSKPLFGHDPRNPELNLNPFTNNFRVCSDMASPETPTIKAVCWTEDTANSNVPPVATSDHQYVPFLLQNVTSKCNTGSGGTFNDGSPKGVVNRQSITSDSAYSEGPDLEQDEEELRFARLGARNPSPPPPLPPPPPQPPVPNDVFQNTNPNPFTSTSSNNGENSQAHVAERPRVPTPPIISRRNPLNPSKDAPPKRLVSYSDDGPSTQSSEVSGSSRDNYFDPRVRKRYSRSSSSRSRSSTPPLRRRSKYSPDRSRQSSRDDHRYRRRDEERHDRSRHSPPDRDRSRSRSPPPNYYNKLSKDCNFRGRGRGFKNGFNKARGGPSGRRRGGGGRGRGGFRSRARGRGPRGAKPNNYTNNYNNDPGYYYNNDPRLQQGEQNYEVGSANNEAPNQEYSPD